MPIEGIRKPRNAKSERNGCWFKWKYMERAVQSKVGQTIVVSSGSLKSSIPVEVQ